MDNAPKSKALVLIGRAEPSGTLAQERASEGEDSPLSCAERVASRVCD